MRRAARTDNNQVEIIAALRRAGVQVWDTHRVGHGFPDALACRWTQEGDRYLYLLEIKSPGCKLTRNEFVFAAMWPVHIVESIEEALNAVALPAVGADGENAVNERELSELESAAETLARFAWREREHILRQQARRRPGRKSWVRFETELLEISHALAVIDRAIGAAPAQSEGER